MARASRSGFRSLDALDNGALDEAQRAYRDRAVGYISGAGAWFTRPLGIVFGFRKKPLIAPAPGAGLATAGIWPLTLEAELGGGYPVRPRRSRRKADNPPR